MKRPLNPSGTAVGCLSACAANLDSNQQDSANCCSGSHATPATCPPSGVAFYSYFKNRCSNSYVYAYDVGHYTSSKTIRLTIACISGILWNCSLDLPRIESGQLRSDVLPVEGSIQKITFEVFPYSSVETMYCRNHHETLWIIHRVFKSKGNSIYKSESMRIYQGQPNLEVKGNVHAQYKYIARNTRGP